MSERPTVLLVDDDASLARAMVRILDVGGLDAVTFGSAEELLAGAPVDADCIVIDVQLPGLDGLALYRLLHAQGAPYPAIFVSAHDEAEELVRALPPPACGFLAKPFTGRALLDAVQRLLQRAA